METKAEKIAVLSNIILHKAQRIKKLKLECGQQATKICVLNERIAELETQLEQLRWIPVSKRLPEVPLGPPNASTESVWLIFKGKPQMGYYTNYDGWRIYGIRFQKRINQKDITHWKPIILP